MSPFIKFDILPSKNTWEVEMERWQLSTKEVARYSVIENAIKV